MFSTCHKMTKYRNKTVIPDLSGTCTMDNNKHLKISKFVLTLVGIWPLQFDSKYQFLQIFYKIYCKAVHIYFFSTSCFQWLELFFLIGSNNLNETVQNIGVSLLYAMDIAKILLCSGKTAKKLVTHIYEAERKIMSGNS